METKVLLNMPRSSSNITETTSKGSHQHTTHNSTYDESQHPTFLLGNINKQPPTKCKPIKLERQPTFDRIDTTPPIPPTFWVSCKRCMEPLIPFGIFVLVFIVFLAAMFTMITQTARMKIERAAAKY